MPQFRTERDSMGEVRLPAEAYYGAQTQRAVENFPISGRTLPTELIHALGLVKWAAATVNRDLGRLDAIDADALIAACREVADGKFDDQFPVDVFQTGSGTSSNMNANEVIARRANELAGERDRSNLPERPGGGHRRAALVVAQIGPVPFSPADPSERSRQLGPEQQRRVSDGHPRGRRRGDSPAADSRTRAMRQNAGRKGRRVARHSEDRADASGRRHSDDARPGDRRAGPADGTFGGQGGRGARGAL